MALPDYQAIMLPLLRFLADENEHSLRESIEYLAEQFKLTDQFYESDGNPKCKCLHYWLKLPKITF